MTNQQIIIYNTDDGKSKVALYAQNGTLWLSQNQLAELFATSVSNINKHIANILKEGKLSENSVIEYFSITAADGKKLKAASAINKWKKKCGQFMTHLTSTVNKSKHGW
ncbi:hypothetical protein M5S25_02945 [Avibacterium paragallinarum]|uniref:Virulence protein n=1 Tax=Avibacterium paragallinarum TaxID=728 RepID=A0ABU7QNE1_AVIPA|nr:hypothetical protein [Avibacterium paragallinarum]